MTLLVKDANTTIQSLSTELDGNGNLVPVHAPASVSQGVASPVGPANPLPVINTAGAAASDDLGENVFRRLEFERQAITPPEFASVRMNRAEVRYRCGFHDDGCLGQMPQHSVEHLRRRIHADDLAAGGGQR